MFSTLVAVKTAPPCAVTMTLVVSKRYRLASPVPEAPWTSSLAPTPEIITVSEPLRPLAACTFAVLAVHRFVDPPVFVMVTVLLPLFVVRAWKNKL